MTDAEQSLWLWLRRKQIHGVQFYRQKPIGNYIVDFHAPAARLAVELDGSQHMETRHAAHDAVRDAYLVSVGLRVLRFDNLQVLKELDAVLSVIEDVVRERLNPPQPPFFKGGSKNIPSFEKVGSGNRDEGIPPFEKGGLGGIFDGGAQE